MRTSDSPAATQEMSTEVVRGFADAVLADWMKVPWPSNVTHVNPPSLLTCK